MSLLLRLLEDLHDAPPLGGRQGPGLHQQDTVADAGDAVFIVCLEPARATDDLAVAGVPITVLDRHHDRLLHLVADDQALAGLAVPTHSLITGGGSGLASSAHSLVLACGAHDSSSVSGPARMPCSRSLMTV